MKLDCFGAGAAQNLLESRGTRVHDRLVQSDYAGLRLRQRDDCNHLNIKRITSRSGLPTAVFTRLLTRQARASIDHACSQASH